MYEGGIEVRIFDGDGNFDEDVLVAEAALLETAMTSALGPVQMIAAGTHLSVVNFPSL